MPGAAIRCRFAPLRNLRCCHAFPHNCSQLIGGIFYPQLGDMPLWLLVIFLGRLLLVLRSTLPDAEAIPLPRKHAVVFFTTLRQGIAAQLRLFFFKTRNAYGLRGCRVNFEPPIERRFFHTNPDADFSFGPEGCPFPARSAAPLGWLCRASCRSLRLRQPRAAPPTRNRPSSGTQMGGSKSAALQAVSRRPQVQAAWLPSLKSSFTYYRPTLPDGGEKNEEIDILGLFGGNKASPSAETPKVKGEAEWSAFRRTSTCVNTV